MKTIAFIGLGIMGSRMAANLQKEGYKLVIHKSFKGKSRFTIKRRGTMGRYSR